MRYHINYDGKIYRCRAKINKCPYGEERHAEDRVELYYTLMKVSRDSEPANGALEEIRATGRLRSLWSMSDEIANSEAPIELILASLDRAIEHVEKVDIDQQSRKFLHIINEGVSRVHEGLRYGVSIPSFVPEEVVRQANEKFQEIDRGKVIEYAAHTRNQKGLNAKERILEMEKDFKMYSEHLRFGITEKNRAGTLNWMKEDFAIFSQALNTSKMLTQSVFYKDINKAEGIIRAMDDYELLSAYDDYLLTDNEILNEIQLANNFIWEDREDLDYYANRKIKSWYDMNRKIVEDWKKNTPKRVMLSMMIAKELDNRGINRADNEIGRIGVSENLYG